MYEWKQTVQRMIDWIEEHLQENITLLEAARHIGYSPYYCSTQFHKVVGMTMKSYIAGRRLCKATIAIRDSEERILDIAIKCGYSSQEALTRAFVSAYHCTPMAYRKNPRPLAFAVRQVVLLPEHYERKGEQSMSEFCFKEPEIRMEYIPAHKYIGIWEDRAVGYGDFWQYHDCEKVCGIIESLRNAADPIIGCHTAGWYNVDGKRRYFYGLGVPMDYKGEIPEGFSVKECPASYYLVFFHPPFDYLKDNDEVMRKVEKLAWNYELESFGMSDKHLDYSDTRKMYQWNEEQCPCYQRHYPEVLGYEVLRPVKLV